MNAQELTNVIQYIKNDSNHHSDRRMLNENYEWLEHFWRYNYGQNDNSINNFITAKGEYYWESEAIRNLAKEFAAIECVGSNQRPDYIQNQEIARATMYLRYSCNLFAKDVPDCISIECRNHKINTGFCNEENALLWNGNFDQIFAFKALMYIIRQVRNNLFHGHKLSVEPIQFNRNKILVKLSSRVTEVLLENLIDSELAIR